MDWLVPAGAEKDEFDLVDQAAGELAFLVVGMEIAGHSGDGMIMVRAEASLRLLHLLFLILSHRRCEYY
jgi:hypothetical protein